MRAGRALAAGALVLLTGACAGTKWVTTWEGPRAEGSRPLRKILVIGMSSETANRRMFEEAMVAKLGESRVDATPSYGVLPRLRLDEDQLKAAVREGGYDGVLITRLVGRRNKTDPAPAGASYDPYWAGYSGWYGEVYTPGYLSSQTVVRLQTRLWSTQDGGSAIWTGVSESVGLDRIARACREVSSLVARDLVKHKLI